MGYLLGCSMNSDTKGRAKRVADAYVDRVKKIFDIDMVPILVWDEETGKIEIGAEPKTDFDQILVERILAREQQEIEGGPEHRDSRPAEVW